MNIMKENPKKYIEKSVAWDCNGLISQAVCSVDVARSQRSCDIPTLPVLTPFCLLFAMLAI